MNRRVWSFVFPILLAVVAIGMSTDYACSNKTTVSDAASRNEISKRSPTLATLAARKSTTASRSGQMIGATSQNMRVAAPPSGLCDLNSAAVRAQIESAFIRVTVPVGTATIYYDPLVPPAIVELVMDELPRVGEMIDARLGLTTTPPDVYLYASSSQLRGWGCVSGSTVSYYDGSVRLASSAQAELIGSLRHEYTHHALYSHGIRGPAWFQEGAAMLLGGERDWRRWQPHKQLLRPDQMVNSFSQTDSRVDQEQLYGQAFEMTRFVNEICEGQPTCGLRNLVAVLVNRTATPESLFDWAISHRGSDLVSTCKLPLWDDYVANGFHLSRLTSNAIQNRSRR